MPPACCRRLPWLARSRPKAEVAELHAIAGHATPDMLAAAKRDAADERPDLFNNVLGFDVTSLPVTSKLLDDVMKEQSADAGAAKKFFHRDRPWIVDSTIETCEMHAPGPAKTSYPSGHATLAFSTGVMLAALVPDKSASHPGACPGICREPAGLRHAFPQRHHGGPGSGHHRRGPVDAGPRLSAREMEAARAELRSQHRIS